jgi:hypothetical protein
MKRMNVMNCGPDAVRERKAEDGDLTELQHFQEGSIIEAAYPKNIRN